MMLYYKSLTIILLLTVIITLLTAFKSFDQQPLEIKILNVGKKGGQLVVEIYNSETNWLKSPYQKMVLSTDKDFQTTTFRVPYGKYAIAIYQDINENGKLDSGIFGIPKEPIGFGNNYRPLGKPQFESASIEFNASSKPQEIKLFEVLQARITIEMEWA